MLYKHEMYLTQHKGERPFPLDGSDWARLVSIRLEHDHDQHSLAGDDLLSKCHSQDASAVATSHQAEKVGIRHWTGEVDMPGQ